MGDTLTWTNFLVWALHSEALHITLLGTWIRVVASLESPTKDSSMWYRNFFRISNASLLQFERINPKIENSPNWNDAVVKAINGGQFTQEFVKNPDFKGYGEKKT